MRWLPSILSIIAHAALIFCVIGLVRRPHFKKVPFFFTYVLYEEVQFTTLFVIVLWEYFGGPKRLYQWVEIIGGAGISSCLQLAVFYEIVNTLVLPHSTARATLQPILRWVTAVAILLAVGISATFSRAGLRPLTQSFEVLNFSANLVNLSLLLALFLFSRTLHISWKSLPAGVALGFGITSGAEIGATSLVSAFGMNGVASADVIRLGAFLICTVVWLAYICLPARHQQFAGESAKREEIEAWHQDMQRIVQP